MHCRASAAAGGARKSEKATTHCAAARSACSSARLTAIRLSGATPLSRSARCFSSCEADGAAACRHTRVCGAAPGHGHAAAETGADKEGHTRNDPCRELNRNTIRTTTLQPQQGLVKVDAAMPETAPRAQQATACVSLGQKILLPVIWTLVQTLSQRTRQGGKTVIWTLVGCKLALLPRHQHWNAVHRYGIPMLTVGFCLQDRSSGNDLNVQRRSPNGQTEDASRP